MNSLVSSFHRRSARAGRPWPTRVLYAIGLVTAISGLLVGFAVAGRIITGSGTGLASVGTVMMHVNGSGTHVCDYGVLAPGDLTGSATCTLSVTYRGSIRAHASADGTDQLEGRTRRGAALRRDEYHWPDYAAQRRPHSFTVPTGSGSTGPPCQVGFTCWTAQDDLAASDAGAPRLIFHRGDTVIFILTPLFVSAAGNSYQGGEAKVALTVQAVQAPANPLPATCNISTIGQPCPASGTFTWR